MLKYLLALMLLLNISLFADVSQGENLERQMWGYIKDKKWKELDDRIAPYFQSALFTGALNKEKYLDHAKTLNASDYKLTNFVVTEGPGIIVVTYNVSVSETIEGKRLSANAARLSVWQNVKDDWKWVAHALLVPVPEEKQTQ